MSPLFSTAGASYMWLLSTCNVAADAEELNTSYKSLNFKYFLKIRSRAAQC